MKQVIDEILLEEKKARERVEAAREEAKQIRLKSDEESRNILDQSKSPPIKEPAAYAVELTAVPVASATFANFS